LEKYHSWVKKWWVVCLVAIIFGIALLIYWCYTHTVTSLFIVLLQVGITSTTTIFVGVLAKNMSSSQGQINQRQQNDQMEQQQRNELRSAQATAITHLSSDNPVIVAAAITEMAGVIGGWDQMAYKNQIDYNTGLKRAQELVDLAFKSTVLTNEAGTNEDVNKARGRALLEISASLKKIELQDLNFENAFLNDAILNKACLNAINLKGAELYDANLDDAQLNGAHLEGANLTKAELKRAQLTEANLNGATLEYANFTNAHLVNAKMYHADLSEAMLDEAFLIDAEMKHANLSDAGFEDAEMKNVVLSNACLMDANLMNARLNNAILCDANLNEANLIGANLRKADLTRARLRYTQIAAIDWEGTILRQADLVDAKIDEEKQRFAEKRPLKCTLLLPPISSTNISNI
jgi:uncharacterized protein YjbI with pentapeptide repeats